MSGTAVIYESRDNSFTLTLYKDDAVLTSAEMATITKFEIKYKGNYYDSDTYPDAFVADDSNGSVTIKPYDLGLEASKDTAELIIYDASDYAHGVVWDQLELIVKGDAIPAS